MGWECKFVKANAIVDRTKRAEQERKQSAEERAVKILEDFDFNSKVREAADEEKWYLDEWIQCPGRDIAKAVADILQDLGYTCGIREKAGSKQKIFGVMVGWSQTTTRAAFGEKR